MRRLLIGLLFLLLASPGWTQECFLCYHPPGTVGVSCTGTTCTFTGPILLPDGTAGAPSLAFSSDADGTGTGFYRFGANEIGATTNGVVRAIFGLGLRFVSSSVYPNSNDDVNGAVGIPTLQWPHGYFSRSIQGGKSKALTDAAAATAFATIAVPTNGQIGGELIWTATSSAAAVRFVANGSIRFWGVDEGGTPVCGINKIGTDGEGHSSGANTLVCTWSNVVATTNCAISVTCTNDTAGVDPVTVNGRLNMPTTATVTFN